MGSQHDRLQIQDSLISTVTTGQESASNTGLQEGQALKVDIRWTHHPNGVCVSPMETRWRLLCPLLLLLFYTPKTKQVLILLHNKGHWTTELSPLTQLLSQWRGRDRRQTARFELSLTSKEHSFFSPISMGNGHGLFHFCHLEMGDLSKSKI